MRRDRREDGEARAAGPSRLPRARAGRALGLAVLLGLAACGVGDEGPEGDAQAALRQARADSVSRAEARFQPAAFDTIGWESWSQRADRGRLVYRVSCRKCHGTGGGGDGDTAERLELDVPSLLGGFWSYAGDQAAIRRRVYVGHESEMPTWGLYGLTYRDIDAVALYIDEVLRQEAGS